MNFRIVRGRDPPGAMRLKEMSVRFPSWPMRFRLLDLPDEGDSPARYRSLRRRIAALMIFVTVVPLFFMAVVNYHQYQVRLKEEIVNPVRVLVNKTKHSFELFLAERLSAVSFIASAYSPDELADQNALNRIFGVMKREFGGFVDLGLIDSSGVQVSYTGPYDLKGKNYSDQSWFHEVQVRGSYVSDVFMGYRKFPHIAMAVQRRTASGEVWILRATIDTEKFVDLISSMGTDPGSDAFLLNKSGVLQTPSKFYGGVLTELPLPLPPVSYEANVIEEQDPKFGPVITAYTYFVHSPYILMAVKPKGEVLRTWYTLKSEIFILFLVSVAVIFIVVLRLTSVLVKHMEESDEKRYAAFREVQQNHKLSSIGRLAAGVAHEINNPMAVINEKAGLMKDLIDYGAEFPEKQKFLSLTDAILQSVNRCKSITHRLLGFARRMEVQIEVLDLNDVVKETLTFLEKESLYRNIELRLRFAEDLPAIPSDRGQLQQVFLNLLNNAFAAVEQGGVVAVTTWDENPEEVAVAVEDNGCGMSEETLRHIFEPFFTTKKETGTGLGLPITYGIVKKLGGEIDVRSEEGKGTTVTVRLPKKAREG